MASASPTRVAVTPPNSASECLASGSRQIEQSSSPPSLSMLLVARRTAPPLAPSKLASSQTGSSPAAADDDGFDARTPSSPAATATVGAPSAPPPPLPAPSASASIDIRKKAARGSSHSTKGERVTGHACSGGLCACMCVSRNSLCGLVVEARHTVECGVWSVECGLACSWCASDAASSAEARRSEGTRSAASSLST